MFEVEYGESSFILDLNEKFSVNLEGKVPFKTSLVVWKEEVYFQIPAELDVSALKSQLKVKRGSLYYWPPERCLCVFYGMSQPYSPVYQVGLYVGLLSKLRAMKGEVEATVKSHRIYEPYLNLVAMLESLGFKVATPFHEGERVVELTRYVNDIRVSFRLHVEDYGVYIEGEPLFPQNYSPENIRLLEALNKIMGRGRYSRLDLSEDGWVTVTGFVEIGKEVQDAINEMSLAYYRIAKMLKVMR